MRAGRVVGGAANPVGGSGAPAGGHLTQVGYCQTGDGVRVADAGGLRQHVADSVESVADGATVDGRVARNAEGIAGIGDSVEVVVSKNLGVAARVAGRHHACWAVVVNGFDVGGIVKCVAEGNQRGGRIRRGRGGDGSQAQARVITVLG